MYMSCWCRQAIACRRSSVESSEVLVFYDCTHARAACVFLGSTREAKVTGPLSAFFVFIRVAVGQHTCLWCKQWLRMCAAYCCVSKEHASLQGCRSL